MPMALSQRMRRLLYRRVRCGPTGVCSAAEVPMNDAGFGRFFLRVTACHMVTYTIAGILAFYLADYQHAFASEHLACYMLPTSSKWVAVGPALQVIRGLVFAVCLYPFRRVFLEERRGWLKLWG